MNFSLQSLLILLLAFCLNVALTVDINLESSDLQMPTDASTDVPALIDSALTDDSPVINPIDADDIPSTSANNANEEDPCVICRHKMQSEDDIISPFQCTHRFHKDCITPWARKNRACPLCQSQIRPPSSLRHFFSQVEEELALLMDQLKQKHEEQNELSPFRQPGDYITLQGEKIEILEEILMAMTRFSTDPTMCYHSSRFSTKYGSAQELHATLFEQIMTLLHKYEQNLERLDAGFRNVGETVDEAISQLEETRSQLAKFRLMLKMEFSIFLKSFSFGYACLVSDRSVKRLFQKIDELEQLVLEDQQTQPLNSIPEFNVLMKSRKL